MGHGYPDFQPAVTPSMPIIGGGQVAWFQSDKAVVAAPGNADLINYVVPDGHQLHVCSGVVCIDFPVLARYDLRKTPAGDWVSPTSHIDPDSVWVYEESAYDGNISTYARVWIEANSWSGYLHLLINQVNIDTVKFYTTYNPVYVTKIDVDVYYEEDWHDVYEGAVATNVWVEKAVLAGTKLISKARVRLYNNAGSGAYTQLNEFQFNTAEATPQEGLTFDTITLIPYQPQAPYIVETGATFAVRVYNDDDAAHTMSAALAGFLTKPG